MANDARNNHYEIKDVFVDEYFHSSPNIIYTPVNIPGPGIEVEEFESQLVGGCSCGDGQCSLEAECECIAKYGKNYTEKGKFLDKNCERPIIECNSLCQCNKNKCSNCIVQRGPLQTLEVYESTNGKGKALRATSDIERGTFVCEYAGEVIGVEESSRRMKLLTASDMNYIFHLKEHLANGSIIHTFIDPTFIGNIGRYINHSCDPNCFVVPVRVNSLVARLAIFTSSFVPASEELTFDYGSLNRNCSISGVSAKICLCEKFNCRKFLPCDL
ncbi:hypothetical protein R5R35_000978 [Gryllus longicercus]|uniref:Histone-lysine N-methyltransferase SETMAR n=1 Tax=Gryllus longicercus TaxID=2509291 RepID=A0AAN9VU10_9ORTH